MKATRSAVSLSIAASCLLSLGCRPASPPKTDPTGSSVADDDEDDEGDSERYRRRATEWRSPASSGVILRDEGLRVVLPRDWAVRNGRGAVRFEARSPTLQGVLLTVSSWEGSPARLQEEYGSAELGWTSAGPFGALALVADEPPRIASRPGENGALHVAWFVYLGGHAVAFEAVLPAVGFEAGWREIERILASVEPLDRPPGQAETGMTR